MDKYESKILSFTAVLLGLFLFAVIFAARSGASDLPECIPYDGAYSEPRVVQLDDQTYQVYMIAQMWNFEPSEIFLPVGAEVDLYLTSKDVVHGFQIADKGLNMMAVYGGVNKATVKFDKPGVYPIICHEYCGSGHQHMMSEIIVNYPQ